MQKTSPCTDADSDVVSPVITCGCQSFAAGFTAVVCQ